MLKLYDDNSSYFWKNRQELLDAWEVLKNKDISVEAKILKSYREWKAQKA